MPIQALRYMGKVQCILRDILARGTNRGDYRQINPFIVHMMIIGSLEFLITGEGIRKRVMDCMSNEFPHFKHVQLDEAIAEISQVVLLSLKVNN